MKIYRMLLVVFLSIIMEMGFAQTKEIAITIDDLPFVGTTHNKPGNLRRERERFMSIMDSLIQHKVPATGFVIAGSIEKDQWDLLQKFHDAGFVIGNHTYTHANLNRTSAERYIDDVAKADQRLKPLMTQPKYFRYPYLAEGRGDTKATVYEYLKNQDYIIAPVTVDSKDFRFNERLYRIHWRNRSKHLGSIKKQYLNYIWQQTLRAEKRAKGEDSVQILLVHANLLNSHCMGDIVQMYKDHGYRIIPLGEALQKIEAAEKAHQQAAQNQNLQS